MDQFLEFGNENKAMSIFVDQYNHIHWASYPSLAFDGYQVADDKRHIILHPSNLDYEHH